jgi:hypothetical protein
MGTGKADLDRKWHELQKKVVLQSQYICTALTASHLVAELSETV